MPVISQPSPEQTQALIDALKGAGAGVAGLPADMLQLMSQLRGVLDPGARMPGQPPADIPFTSDKLARSFGADPNNAATLAGMLLAPVPGGKIKAVKKINPGAARKNLNDFMARNAEKEKQIAVGQEILDDIEEAGGVPLAIGKKFWAETYPILNREVKEQFEGMVRALGFKPGDVIAIEKNGTKVIGKTWQELGQFLSDDLPREVEHLQGPERGFVSLMEWANRQLQNALPKKGQQALLK